LFFTRRTYLRLALCALSQKGQGFAEPGALSSTSPIDLPLPRTAPRESFVLLASRARRSGNLRSARDRRKGIRRETGRKLRSSAGFLQRKHVVVTDAGSGIGRAIALRPARDCATLTLLARGRTGWRRRRRRSRGARASRAATFAPRGVQVNAICPGWVDTDMAWQGLDAAAAEIGGARPGGYCDAVENTCICHTDVADTT